MSFNTGLSGIRAAASELNITGNSIANAGTVGFKGSRAEFSDVYAASVLGSGSNAVGSGVTLGNVGQLFNQGAVNFTENSLDLAINGNGFFVTSNNGAMSYTRAGYFGTDNQGNIVNNFGERLQGYKADETGEIKKGDQIDLRVDTRAANPAATSKVSSTLNLNSSNSRPAQIDGIYKAEYASVFGNPGEYFDNDDRYEGLYKETVDNYEGDPGGEEAAAANAVALAVAREGFSPSESSSYNSSTSVNVFDSLGNPHVLTKYFVKVDGGNWDMHLRIDGDPIYPENDDGEQVGEAFRLEFGPTGQLSSGGKVRIKLDGLASGAKALDFELNLEDSTQYAANFAVTAVSQDGFTTRDLAGLEINDEGLLVARYTNGQTKVQGQVMLASFPNQQGLMPLGKTAWAESSTSGGPVKGSPGSSTLGKVQSGALEQSNVDLSEQLINLIVAQRNYQANSKTIQTEDAVTQTIINLR